MEGGFDMNVKDYYEGYDEEGRLARDPFHRTEFLLTLRMLEPYIREGDRILDIGSGPGAYTFHYASLGHEVTAVDLSPKHVSAIRSKAEALPEGRRVTAYEGDATDLPALGNAVYDAVLCMGPLYHLNTEELWDRCLKECLRFLKPGGILAAAYVNRAGAYLYRALRNPEVLTEQHPDVVFAPDGTFRDGCFHHASPEEVERVMARYPLERLEHAATDGVSALMKDTVNRLDGGQYQAWLDYLYRVNREPHQLGTSLHNLYIARKI